MEGLFRYFRKELSPSEIAEVEGWRDANPQNQTRFEEIRLMHLDLKGLDYYQKLEVPADQSWEKFNKEHKVAKVRKLTPTTVILRAAASIVVVLSAVFLVYRYQNQPTEVSIADLTAVEAVQLNDGSDITLNEGASLAYTEPFQNNERRVRLEGNGFFDIARNPEKPFVVEVQDVEVRVLGTQFYINQNAEQIDLKVEEGKVLISYQDHHEIVEAGAAVSVDLTTSTVSAAVPDESGLDTFWKSRRLIFNLTSIEEVVEVVNQAYGTTVSVEGATTGCSLTVVFENESLENVLEIISSTLNYEVVNQQGVTTLRGDGCE